jgi:uncharacterized membrane protein YdjX (TVP38/TMEM64 family)
LSKFSGEKHLSQKQKKIFSGIMLAVLLIFVSIVTILIGKPMIESISEPEHFREWVSSYGFLGKLIYVGMVIIQVIFAIIPGEPLEIGGGYAFGALEGTILCLIGITIGSMIVFALVRTIGVRVVEIFYPIEKIRSLKFLQNTERFNVVTYIIFFMPGTPKDLLTYFIGLTDMKWQTWLFITFLSRIPSVLTSTLSGSALGEENYLTAIIVLVITILLSIIGIVIYHIVCKKHNK